MSLFTGWAILGLSPLANQPLNRETNMTRQLTINQPFDLKLSLTMGQAFRWQPLGDGWFSGVLGENLFHIRQAGGLNCPVEYRVGGAQGECDATDEHDAMLRRYFREDDDITAIYADISHDKVVAEFVQKYPGMRVLRQDPWECLVSYILSQTASIEGIKRSVTKIATLSRRSVKIDSNEQYVFPLAEQVVAYELSALGDLRLGLEKASNLLTAGKQICAGTLDLERLTLPSVSCFEATRRLDDCPGIGPKIASCVALMSLDKLNAFPVDRWVLRALDEGEFDDCPMPRKNAQGQYQLYDRVHWQLIDWGQRRFGRYAGYAGQYLFHGINPHKETESNKHANRSRVCPKCGAEVGSSCRYPSD